MKFNSNNFQYIRQIINDNILLSLISCKDQLIYGIIKTSHSGCRAQNTLNTVLEAIEQTDIPVHKTWRLNERHYGGKKQILTTLQGNNFKAMNEMGSSYLIIKKSQSLKIGVFFKFY